FFRRAAALPVITAKTGGDDVIPTLLTPRGDRYDVIERQVLRWKLLAAVLACIVVARIDVGARKLYAVMVFHANILQEPDDRWQLDGERNRVNLIIVCLDNFHFSGK